MGTSVLSKKGMGEGSAACCHPRDVHLHGHLWFSTVVHETLLSISVTKPASQLRKKKTTKKQTNKKTLTDPRKAS